MTLPKHCRCFPLNPRLDPGLHLLARHGRADVDHAPLNTTLTPETDPIYYARVDDIPPSNTGPNEAICHPLD